MLGDSLDDVISGDDDEDSDFAGQSPDEGLDMNPSAEALFEGLQETPMEPRPLVLNPGREGPKNPLCPECEEQIVPLSREFERQFTCGCDTIWRFEFGVDEVEVSASTTNST